MLLSFHTFIGSFLNRPHLYYQFHSSIREKITSVIHPERLLGLKQAVFVMKCLVDGHAEKEIANMLGGDKQLVSMWSLFLKHNGWMEAEIEGWSITTKGLEWSNRLTTA